MPDEVQFTVEKTITLSLETIEDLLLLYWKKDRTECAFSYQVKDGALSTFTVHDQYTQQSVKVSAGFIFVALRYLGVLSGPHTPEYTYIWLSDQRRDFSGIKLMWKENQTAHHPNKNPT